MMTHSVRTGALGAQHERPEREDAAIFNVLRDAAALLLRMKDRGVSKGMKEFRFQGRGDGPQTRSAVASVNVGLRDFCVGFRRVILPGGPAVRRVDDEQRLIRTQERCNRVPDADRRQRTIHRPDVFGKAERSAETQ